MFKPNQIKAKIYTHLVQINLNLGYTYTILTGYKHLVTMHFYYPLPWPMSTRKGTHISILPGSGMELFPVATTEHQVTQAMSPHTPHILHKKDYHAYLICLSEQSTDIFV